MGACTAFIFAALIEFTVVNYLSRKHGCCGTNRRRKYEQHSLYMTRNGTDQQTQVNTNTYIVHTNYNQPFVYKYVISRQLYPFVWILHYIHVRDKGRQCQSRITTHIAYTYDFPCRQKQFIYIAIIEFFVNLQSAVYPKGARSRVG